MSLFLVFHSVFQLKKLALVLQWENTDKPHLASVHSLHTQLCGVLILLIVLTPPWHMP